jgi:hypothetical protein
MLPMFSSSSSPCPPMMLMSISFPSSQHADNMIVHDKQQRRHLNQSVDDYDATSSSSSESSDQSHKRCSTKEGETRILVPRERIQEEEQQGGSIVENILKTACSSWRGFSVQGEYRTILMHEGKQEGEEQPQLEEDERRQYQNHHGEESGSNQQEQHQQVPRIPRGSQEASPPPAVEQQEENVEEVSGGGEVLDREEEEERNHNPRQEEEQEVSQHEGDIGDNAEAEDVVEEEDFYQELTNIIGYFQHSYEC